MASLTVGVGHIFTAMSSGMPKPFPLRPFALSRFLRSVQLSLDSCCCHGVGVGHKPPSLSEMRSRSVLRGYNVPSTVIPERGQLSDHGSSVGWPSIFWSNKQTWDIFQIDSSRLYLANDSKGIWKKISIVAGPTKLSGLTIRLAGWAGRDDIHSATPGESIELSDIVPDGGIVKDTVPDPGLEDGLTVGVPLDIADGSGFDAGESKGKIEAAVSTEQTEAGRYFHISPSTLGSRLAIA